MSPKIKKELFDTIKQEVYKVTRNYKRQLLQKIIKRKDLQSLSRTGFSCNHCTILGLFQFIGCGLGCMLYSVARRLISRRNSPFCGFMDALGSLDHGSLSKEKTS